jgi:hypothetical protein
MGLQTDSYVKSSVSMLAIQGQMPTNYQQSNFKNSESDTM